MTVRIVRLGTERLPDEGIRIGMVRRPPRGVPKSVYASKNGYDGWFQNLAPSIEIMKLGQGVQTDEEWKSFLRKYRSEMSTLEAGRTLDLLAALSHQTNFSVGCYCADEVRCHRSALRELLVERGANLY